MNNLRQQDCAGAERENKVFAQHSLKFYIDLLANFTFFLRALKA